ncbi:hypothetical protein HY469_01680, partial [Candidatus Roizmanbacteria bacterium]|nr:hypothetical protein [Candidatus Roizmanbacteria bacterium]
VKKAGSLPFLCNGCEYGPYNPDYIGCDIRTIRGIPTDIFIKDPNIAPFVQLPEGMIAKVNKHMVEIKPDYENETQLSVSKHVAAYVFRVFLENGLLRPKFLTRHNGIYHPNLEARSLMYWTHRYFTDLHGEHNIRGILSYWHDSPVLGDNYHRYKENLQRGLSPSDAALQTFTGDIAQDLGYSQVDISDDVGNESYYVWFTRPTVSRQSPDLAL